MVAQSDRDLLEAPQLELVRDEEEPEPSITEQALDYLFDHIGKSQCDHAYAEGAKATVDWCVANNYLHDVAYTATYLGFQNLAHSRSRRLRQDHLRSLYETPEERKIGATAGGTPLFRQGDPVAIGIQRPGLSKGIQKGVLDMAWVIPKRGPVRLADMDGDCVETIYKLYYDAEKANGAWCRVFDAFRERVPAGSEKTIGQEFNLAEVEEILKSNNASR